MADAPAVDAAGVAKAWLLALVADAPLAAAGSVPAADLARGGPALCAGVLAALASDEALERLAAGDGRAPIGASAGKLTGARTPGALTAGVEALRAATWRALRAELRDPAPELVADLADRLAHVCARVVEASLDAGVAEAPSRAGGPLAEALATATPPPPTGIRAFVPHPARPRPEDDREAEDDPRAAAAQRDAATSPDDSAPPPGARRVAAEPEEDPLAEAARLAAERFATGEDEPDAPRFAADQEPSSPPPAGVHIVDLPAAPETFDPLTSLAEELASTPPPDLRDDAMYAPSADAPTVTRLRAVDTTWDDQREEQPPWLAAIARRLERRVQDGLPFAVFVVEIDDLDRLLAAQSGREVALALETAERGLTAELAPADLVVRERLGRWWLTSPDRDISAARDLGTRVATAIAHAQLGGAPLSASIGLASCPTDGDSTDQLAAHADASMFTARAAGLPLA